MLEIITAFFIGLLIGYAITDVIDYFQKSMPVVSLVDMPYWLINPQ